MSLEMDCLLRAVNKINSVIIVKRYDAKTQQTKLIYVSPNADIIGMNANALLKGFRLTGDYVYPDDRADFVNTLENNYADGIKDFVCEYRIVDDGGELRWIKNHISYECESDNTILIEYLLEDITSTRNDNSIKSNSTSLEEDKSQILASATCEVDLTKMDKMTELVKSFSGISGLYSTIIDSNGNILIKPTGPDRNIGEFYDLFERPNYKVILNHLNEVILKDRVPIFMELNDDNPQSKIAAAPIFVGEEHIGTWIICSYTDEESDKLKEVYIHQWTMAELLSEYLINNSVVENEIAKRKYAENKLEIELYRDNIVHNALCSNKDIDVIINEVLSEGGRSLDIDDIAVYSTDDNKHFKIQYNWNVSSNGVTGDLDYKLNDSYRVFFDTINKLGSVVIDSSNVTKEQQKKLDQHNKSAVIIYPIMVNNIIKNWIVFSSSSVQKTWIEADVNFCLGIKLAIENVISKIEGDGNIRVVNKHLIDTYNYFKVGIFIRDANTGEVLFANTAINTMLGYDFTGKDSRSIITDLRDRFNGIDAMRKPFITKNKEFSWRSYIKALDAILDITEVQIDWYNGQAASLIILRNAQD